VTSGLRLRRVPEAPLRETKFGLVADVDGWFVVNARDARWRDFPAFGKTCDFEGKRAFRQLGININILEPGQSLGLYHREKAQEDFLILAGTCVLIVEDEERELKAWDFVHCPPGTNHMIVAAGDGPTIVLAVGARGRGRSGIVYPVSETAANHSVSAKKETADPKAAYDDFPGPSRVAYQEGWLPDF
jgi:uncharacterized cupin superfamily protein